MGCSPGWTGNSTTADSGWEAGAAVAAGADGITVEVHPKPEEAFSDGSQSLKPNVFEQLMKEIEPFVRLMGKTL